MIGCLKISSDIGLLFCVGVSTCCCKLSMFMLSDVLAYGVHASAYSVKGVDSVSSTCVCVSVACS